MEDHVNGAVSASSLLMSVPSGGGSGIMIFMYI